MAMAKRMFERTREFQAAVIDEYRGASPGEVVEIDLWRDLLKTARALANNGGEADGTQSRADFIQKFHLCLKEGKECQQILAALMHTVPSRAIRLSRLKRACDEIVAILVTSLKTAKSNQSRQERNLSSRRR